MDWVNGFVAGLAVHLIWDVLLVLLGVACGSLYQRLRHKHNHNCMRSHVCVWLWCKAKELVLWWRFRCGNKLANDAANEHGVTG